MASARLIAAFIRVSAVPAWPSSQRAHDISAKSATPASWPAARAANLSSSLLASNASTARSITSRAPLRWPHRIPSAWQPSRSRASKRRLHVRLLRPRRDDELDYLVVPQHLPGTDARRRAQSLHKHLIVGSFEDRSSQRPAQTRG